MSFLKKLISKSPGAKLASKVTSTNSGSTTKPSITTKPLQVSKPTGGNSPTGMAGARSGVGRLRQAQNRTKKGPLIP